MEDPIIKVENLGKSYLVGHQKAGRERYTAMRDVLATSAKQLFRKTKDFIQGKQVIQGDEIEEFWALRRVSFEVKRGEVLGIIGRNGAGKSTLLKLLSRITEPTEGRISIKGRIASLLEVGTGFHPELSGRENIFLNGAILGMTKSEIRAKFDEIVDFAGVEQFIDTPVKRYSSGMYVRLAFAVAAHLEPEILILDEVLAVGDAEFQKKCLGKMKDVAVQGRTVLFVSHTMAAVNNLCTQAILLKNGVISMSGAASDVISSYINSGFKTSGEVHWYQRKDAPGNKNVYLNCARVICNDRVCSDVSLEEEFHIDIEYTNLNPELPLSISIHILDKNNTEVLASGNMSGANLIVDEWFGKKFPEGKFSTRCTMPAFFLNENKYFIRVVVLSHNTKIEFQTHELLSFTTYDPGAMRKEFLGQWLGVVRPKLAWQTKLISNSTNGGLETIDK